jgi:hypothetical protein
VILQPAFSDRTQFARQNKDHGGVTITLLPWHVRCHAALNNLSKAANMSTIWEMAQIIRAEEAAALAAKSEATQNVAAARVNELKAPARATRSAATSLRSLLTRLVHRKTGPAL